MLGEKENYKYLEVNTIKQAEMIEKNSEKNNLNEGVSFSKPISEAGILSKELIAGQSLL